MNMKHISYEYLLKARRITWENAEVIDHLFRFVSSEEKSGVRRKIDQDLYEDVNEDSHCILVTKQDCRPNVEEVTKELFVLLDYNKATNVSVFLSHLHHDEYVNKYSSSSKFCKEPPAPTDNTSSATDGLMTVSSPQECSREDNQNTCSICHKTFKYKSLFTRHLRTHTEEKPFSCPQCEKKFTQKSHLNQHLLIHSGTKRFSCDICRKSFIRSSELKRHLLVHSAIKAFSCDICFKLFAQKSNLISHRRTHTGDKPYKCNSCNAMFSQRSLLTAHMRTHTGETPYQCAICEKKFTHLSTLTNHLLIHSEEKPFACTYSNCNQTCRTKGDLQKHYRVHTKEKPYSCPLCKKRFAQSSNCRRHVNLCSG